MIFADGSAKTQIIIMKLFKAIPLTPSIEIYWQSIRELEKLINNVQPPKNRLRSIKKIIMTIHIFQTQKVYSTFMYLNTLPLTYDSIVVKALKMTIITKIHKKVVFASF